MLFKKENKVPAEITAAGVDKWYSELDDQGKLKLFRYLSGLTAKSPFDFFTSVIDRALADENYKFGVDLCNGIYENYPMDDYQKFLINERLIEAYIGCERYDDSKAACEANFQLYPVIRDRFLADNIGIVPDKVNFRNRYIDVIVGIDSSYDLAFEMLEKYNQMGLLSDEDLVYRREGIKTHRLQRIFDGVYSYRPVGEK